MEIYFYINSILRHKIIIEGGQFEPHCDFFSEV
jgi:hypothetical protein